MSGKYPLDCTFTVEGGSGGVAAVIQLMKFRTSQLEGHNASCVDYVQVCIVLSEYVINIVMCLLKTFEH